MYTTDQYQGLIAETVTMRGDHGEMINAFLARPMGAGPFPGMVLVHHMPGWDAWYMEIVLKFAYYGYAALCPNLYYRAGHGTAEDVAARVRGQGGIPDAQAVGDLEGALRMLQAQPYINGKVGIFGTCSGGRHAYLTACQVQGFSAVVDCWGGRVVMAPEELTPNQPVSPIDYTSGLSSPLLGLFGNDDRFPTPEQVNHHEQALQQQNKVYEFHRYDNAGHGFFYHDRAAYRQAQAVDGWNKVWIFLEKYL